MIILRKELNMEVAEQEVRVPDWREIHATNIPTIKHIPKMVRGEWTRVFTETVNHLLEDTTQERGWALLYMLAKAIFPAFLYKRKGVSRGKDSPGDVARGRMKRWRKGEMVELWEEAEEKGEQGGRERPRRRRR